MTSSKAKQMLEEKMTNCPKCGKPILNGGLFTSPARFTIRCPWCQSTLQINIQPRILTEVIKIGNGDTAKAETKNTQEHEQAQALPASVPESIFAHLSLMDKNQESSLENRIPSNGRGMKVVGYLYPEEPEKTEF